MPGRLFIAFLGTLLLLCTGASAASAAPPAPPVVTTPAVTSNPLFVTGTAVPGATVKLYFFNWPDQAFTSYLGDFAIAGPTGDFTIVTSVGFGPRALRLTQTVAGEESAQAELNTNVLLNDPTILMQPATVVQVGSTVAVHGAAVPSYWVHVFVNGEPVGDPVQAGYSDSQWTTTFTAAAGDNVVTASQDDGGAAHSLESDPVHVFGVALPVITSPAVDAVVAPTFELAGTGQDTGLITIKDGSGATLGTATVTDGHWTLATTAPLMPGARTLSLTQTVLGVTSSPTLFSVSVQPPVATLTSPAGGVSGAGAVSFGGSALPGASIDLYDGGNLVAPDVATADASTGAFSASHSFAVGAHALSVRQRVNGSVGSLPSGESAVTVLPDAPTLTGPATVLSGGSIELTGAALPGASISVTRAGLEVATATADPATGVWTATAPATSGDNSFTALQTLSTFASAPSAPVHVLGLGQPVVNSPSPEGVVSPIFSVTGTGPAGATVTLHDVDAASDLGTAVVGAGGTFVLATTDPLAPGHHALSLDLTLDGLTGALQLLAVAVLPPAPTLTDPADGLSPLAFTGVAMPGSSVAIYPGAGSAPLQTTTAAADTGAYSFTLDLTPGTHTLKTTQSIEGLEGPASALVVVTVTAPVIVPDPVDSGTGGGAGTGAGAGAGTGPGTPQATTPSGTKPAEGAANPGGLIDPLAADAMKPMVMTATPSAKLTTKGKTIKVLVKLTNSGAKTSAPFRLCATTPAMIKVSKVSAKGKIKKKAVCWSIPPVAPGMVVSAAFKAKVMAAPPAKGIVVKVTANTAKSALKQTVIIKGK